jgi:hypothetical protein
VRHLGSSSSHYGLLATSFGNDGPPAMATGATDGGPFLLRTA